MAKCVALGELERREGIGIIRADVHFAVCARLVALDVILGKAIQFRWISGDDLLVIRNVTIESRLLIRKLIVELLQLRSRGIVFVDARQAEL